MKKLLSLFISFVMLFNLTAETFASPTKFVSKKEETHIKDVLNSAYEDSTLAQNTSPLNAYDQAYSDISLELDAQYKQYSNLNQKIYEVISLQNVYTFLSSQYQTDTKKYKNKVKSYEEKIEALGGEGKFAQEYDLYQRWLALKPEMDTKKEDLEKIINGNDKSAARKAKKELKEYEKFYEYQPRFDQFSKTLESLENMESDLETSYQELQKFSQEIDNYSKQEEELMQEFIRTLSLDKDSNWDAISKQLEEELNLQYEQIKKTQEKFKKVEAEQEKAYEADLQKRLETSFADAAMTLCKATSADAEKYLKPAVHGRVNGKKVDVSSDSVEMYNEDGSFHPLTAMPKPHEAWKRHKQTFLNCINPSWDKKLLDKYKANITMDELASLKYGEYLIKYNLPENGRNLSEDEIKEQAQQLARATIALLLINKEIALAYFYSIVGDYYQTNDLIKHLRDQWKNNYGEMLEFTENGNWAVDINEDSKEKIYLLYTPWNSDEGDKLQDSYTRMDISFSNVSHISRTYFDELKKIQTNMLNYLADQNYAEALGTTTLKDFNVGFSNETEVLLKDILSPEFINGNLSAFPKVTPEFLKSIEELINTKIESNVKNHQYTANEDGFAEAAVSQEQIDNTLNSLNKTYTKEEQDEIIKKKVKIRPVDPLVLVFSMSMLMFSYNIDRSIVYKREKAAYYDAFQINESEKLLDILFLNSIIQDKEMQRKRDQENLSAWNKFAYAISPEGRHPSQPVLTIMYTLGSLINYQYQEKPEKYLEKFEDSLHDKILNFILDVFPALILGAIVGFAEQAASQSFKTSFKTLTRSSLKSLSKSRLKTTLKLTTKRAKLKITPANNIIKALPKNKPTNIKLSLFSNFQFKGRFTNGNTLGRTLGAQNAFIPKVVGRIKNNWTIRPTAASTSKVFSQRLPKDQVEKLSRDLDDFYKMQRKMPKQQEVNLVRNGNLTDLSSLKKKTILWLKKTFRRKKPAVKIKVKQNTNQVVSQEADNAWITDTPQTSQAASGRALKPTARRTPATANVASRTGNSSLAENSLTSPNEPLPRGVTENKYASEEYKKIASLEKKRANIEMEKTNKIKNIKQNNKMTEKQKRDAINKEESKAYEKTSAIDKQIEELKKSLPPVKRSDARNSISTEEISSLKGNNLSQNEKVQKLMANSNVSETTAYMDDTGILRFVRNRENNIKFNSKAEINIYIKRNSNGKFNSLKDLNKALDAEHPLHNDALSFIERDPAFKDYEVIISKNTPGYPTLNMNQELRIPLPKFIANFSSSGKNINIKAVLKNNGEILHFQLDPKHTHGLQLNRYVDKFLNGDILAVMRKNDHELLIVYDRVKNNNYVIGIIQENPKRGINLLVTNYSVNLKGLSEQFVNKGEILYLRNPSPTPYNQNAVNKLLEDIRKITKLQK